MTNCGHAIVQIVVSQFFPVTFWQTTSKNMSEEKSITYQTRYICLCSNSLLPQSNNLVWTWDPVEEMVHGNRLALNLSRDMVICYWSADTSFSSPEPMILLACGRNRELWEQPFQACAIDAHCVKPDGQNSAIAFTFLCYFKMVAPRAPIFRPLVKGNEDSGYEIADTLFWQLSINLNMDFQYQRSTYGNGATLLYCNVSGLAYERIAYGRTDSHVTTKCF